MSKTSTIIEYNQFLIAAVGYLIAFLAITNMTEKQLGKASLWYGLATIIFLLILRNLWLNKRREKENIFDNMYNEFMYGKGPSLDRFLRLCEISQSSFLSKKQRLKSKKKVDDITKTYQGIAKDRTDKRIIPSSEDIKDWLEIISNLNEDPSYYVKGEFPRICTIIYQINLLLNTEYDFSQISEIQKALKEL